MIHTGNDAAEQSNLIAKYIIPYTPTRDRSSCDKENSEKCRINAQYHVRSLDGSPVIVCAKTFQSITLYSKLHAFESTVFTHKYFS